MGIDHLDDAGVYRLTDDIALVQTIDFFTPIVDDPFTFGQIAAANALSDVYAMGGKPLTAMNMVAFPIQNLDRAILAEILKGGYSKVQESGALLVGGHSIEDSDTKYGLSVTGVVNPKKIITNTRARPGDRRVLTKPLGTGIMATALKGKMASREAMTKITESMTTLNRVASEVMVEVGANACTDITGFGFLGHAVEMATASDVGIVIQSQSVPIFPEAEECPAGPRLRLVHQASASTITPELPGRSSYFYLISLLDTRKQRRWFKTSTILLLCAETVRPAQGMSCGRSIL